MRYELIIGGVIDNHKGSIVPESNDNEDWIEYQQWLHDGNAPRPIKTSMYHYWDESKGKWVEDKDKKDKDEVKHKKLKLGLDGLVDVLIEKGLLVKSDIPGL